MTPTARLLLDCLHQDPARLDPNRLACVSEEDWQALLDLAGRQHVRPLILRRLTQNDVRLGVPAEVLATLATSCRAIARRNLALHVELARLLKIFQAAGIPVIVLKGMHVATAVYGNPALREIGDMDLLVRREHLERAVRLVVGAGYRAGTHFDIDVDVTVSQHVAVLSRPPGFDVELHWNLTEPRRRHSIDPSSLWNRAVTSRPWPQALVLSSEDLLLHLCMHLSYHHRFEFGIRSLYDLSELLRARLEDIDWESIRARAVAWRWLGGVQLGLLLARDLLGAPTGPWRDGMGGRHDVIDAAAAQVLSAHVDDIPGSRVFELESRRSAWGKLRYLAEVVRLPREDLRHAYPRASPHPWISWAVYLLRSWHLVRRHTTMLVRLWIARDGVVRAVAERQQLIQAYLADS